MEASRELDQIRAELNSLHERSNNNKVAIATLEAVNEQRFEHILACLETVKKELAEQNASIASLQSMATEGKTSLKTLLWIGGFIASVTAFFVMISEYIPK
jgi:hypothetical protein